MIHELRVYHCVPGRLPALLKRFETITLKLWEKHGIRQARLLDRADRRWQQRSVLHAGLGIAGRARAEVERIHVRSGMDRASAPTSEKDGPIIAKINNQFLQPTAFSAVK